MTPTPPSPDDDILDLAGLDQKPGKAKAATPESDFEKELEALFAEDLTEPELKTPAPGPVSAPAAGPAAGPAAVDDILLLEDLMPAPAATPPGASDEDALDLGDFSAPVAAAPAATDDEALDLGAFAAPEPSADADDEALDLGAFAAGGELDITPPEDTSGGKDGGIDTAALDDLISGLAEPAAPAEDRPHDETDMADLLETINVPKAAAKSAPLSEPADEMLELSLGDLVETAPVAEPLSDPTPVAAAELPDLGMTLPDFSEPEPLAAEDLDMGGDLNLSLDETGAGAAAPDAEANQFLDTGELDLTGMMAGGMMEGLEAPAEEPQAEQSLGAAELLDQIADVEPVAAPVAAPAPQGGLMDDAFLAPAMAAPASAAAAIPDAALKDLQEKLAALTTQVMGGSVAVVRLEGQLAEKDQALAAVEQRLHSSQDEGQLLRRELSDLRAQLEETLRQRAQADERTATEFKERLALVEDRQIQIDRDVRTEIERAVPREAARVIREEIAALAASMHEE